MSDLIQVVAGGITIGCLYAVLLLGVLLVFQVSKTVNFAYGQVAMVGGFGCWFLYAEHGLPVWAALVLSALAAIGLNGAIDLVAIRRIPPDRPGLDLVVTLGLFLLLSALAQQLIDANSHTFVPLGGERRVELRGVLLSLNDLLVVGAAVVAVGLAWWLLARTGLGTSLRASAEDPLIASAAGVDVKRLRTATWAAAGLLAAVVGWFVGSRLTVDAFYMTPVLIKVFVAGMIGGLDRFWLPLGLAVLLGVYESLAVFIFGSQSGTPAVFVLIIVVLAVLPRRLLSERSEARA